MKIAIDWDDVLVNATTKEWLPGAVQALRELVAIGERPFVHSCRASWPEGLAEIQQKLASAHIDIPVVAKPAADVYVDDKAVRFESWSQVMGPLRRERAQAEGLKLARRMLAK